MERVARGHTHALPTTCGLSGSASFAGSSAFFCDVFAQGLPGACPSALARVLAATADPRRPRVSPQPLRGSSGGSAPLSRARSWTCSRRSSPRLATRTFSCARRWRSRSTCRSPESRCARGTPGQDRGAGPGGGGPGVWFWGGLTDRAAPPRPPPPIPHAGPEPGRGDRVKGTSLEPWIRPLAPGRFGYQRSFLGLRENKEAPKVKCPEGPTFAPIPSGS